MLAPRQTPKLDEQPLSTVFSTFILCDFE